MLFNVKIGDDLSFDLALVQWYDFLYKNDAQRLYKYDCPLLQITNTVWDISKFGKILIFNNYKKKFFF
jgi:hypothetical protein